jgi:hypothetical protein
MHRVCGKSLITGELRLEFLQDKQFTAPLHRAHVLEMLREVGADRGDITNLTDAQPVIYLSSVEANTEPSTCDVLGRRYFVRLSYQF